MLKIIIKKIISKIMTLPYKILKLFDFNLAYALLISFAKECTDSKYDISVNVKLKNNMMPFCFSIGSCIPRFAIVLQGPIRYEEDYTLKTVEYYKKIYPQAVIVVSTWIDEDEKFINKLFDLGVEVVLSDKPNYSGHGNINYQIVSSSAGIKRVEDLGIEYVCKTRTDQRVLKPMVFYFLLELLCTVPVDQNVKQKKRIIVLSMIYGNMFTPYLMSDFFYFGTTEDIKKIFSINLDNRPHFTAKKEWKRKDYVNNLEPAEIYLLQGYLKSIGANTECSIKNYWECVKKYMICIDRKIIDLQWLKYDGHHIVNEFFGDYFIDDDSNKLKTMNFDFINWFNLYTGKIEYIENYEQYLDESFR